MNKYVSPNKKYVPSTQKLLMLATSLLTSTAMAQEVPQLFSGDKSPEINPVTSTDISAGEQIIFDIHAAGRYQGNALVRYTDEWVAIENPNDILDQVPPVKNIEAFRPLFTGKISTTTGKSIAKVGSIKVDPFNFKIDIRIAPEQALAVSGDNIPTLNESTVNNVSLANRVRVTGETDFKPSTNDSISLFHNLSLSRGNWRAFMSGNLVKSEGYDYGNMFVEHNVGRNVYGAGMLRTNGGSLIASENIYGVKLESNQRGYGDLDNLNATPIDIFVPSRSKVRIYRNETQLIYSADHDFGLQNISTKRFPTGSYEVLIEIEENNGTITQERRFFNKSGRLTPRGLPEYSVVLGVNRSDLEAGDKPVYQIEYATRMLDNLQFSTNLYGIDGSFVVEPKLSGFFGNGYEYDAALSLTSNNDTAFIGNFSYVPTSIENRLSWYTRLTHTLTGHDHIQNEVDPEDLFTQSLSNERSVFSANVTYRLKNTTWSFNALRTKNSDTEASYSYGPNVAWRLFYRNGHQITANANLTKTREDTNHSVFVNYRFKPLDSKWDYRASAGRANVGAKNYNQLRQEVTYDGRQGSKQGTSLNLSNNSQFDADNNNSTSTAFLTHDMKYAGLTANYQRTQASTIERNESLDVQLDSDIIVMQDDLLDPETRDFAIVGSRGGRNNNVIVTLKGNAKDELVDININGIPKVSARVGEKVAFDLPAYSGSEITITPSNESSGLLSYDKSPVRIKLYPGNIAQKEWTVNRVYLISGRAVDVNGKPLAWQRVEGANNYITTDSDGFFQMELLGNETPYVNTSKHQCVLALPTLKKEEQFVQVGDITCG